MMAGKSENKTDELKYNAWACMGTNFHTELEKKNDDERYPYGPVKLLMNTLIILLCVKRERICLKIKREVMCVRTCAHFWVEKEKKGPY